MTVTSDEKWDRFHAEVLARRAAATELMEEARQVGVQHQFRERIRQYDEILTLMDRLR